MTDGGDDGDLRFVDGARHALVVERPEVLDGAAAAARDDEVCDLVSVRVAQRAGDLRRGLGSLHAHAEELDLRQRPARAENAEHIVHRRAGGRGDDGDGFRVPRQRLLMRGVEQPLALQLRLELLEGDVQVARALRRELGDIKLIGPVAREHADAPEGDDLHAVLGTEAQTQGVSLEQHAAHRALGVLEREVVVARGVELVV